MIRTVMKAMMMAAEKDHHKLLNLWAAASVVLPADRHAKAAHVLHSGQGQGLLTINHAQTAASNT